MRKSAVIIALLSLLVALPCRADSLPVNQQPMYGGVEKTEAMKRADQDFLSSVAKMGYSKEAGSEKSVALGWQYFSKGDVTTAMTRFNQAWLQNPENGNAFHGFAVVTAQRGALAESEKYFKMAVSKPGVQVTAFVDYAHLLNMKGSFDEAIVQAKKALLLSPTARNARIQISYSFLSKREPAPACDWARQAKANGDDIIPPDYVEAVCHPPRG